METTPHQIRSAIIERINHFRQLAEAHYGETFPIVIRFDLKGRAAGQACAPPDGPSVIRINLQMVEKGGTDHLLNQTIPHEVAHVVQYRYSGFPKNRTANTPHGHYWEKVMCFFGVKADRCHNIPLEKSRVQRKWKYACNCRTHSVSTVKHRRILSNPTAYKCNSCKGAVTFKGRDWGRDWG